MKRREREIFIVTRLAAILTHVVSRDHSGWVERGR